MAFVKELPVRFDDVDYARVVYFPKLLGYCHQTFEDFFASEGLPFAELLHNRRIGFPPVHVEADFRSPLRFGDICRVAMEPIRIGKGSLTCRYALSCPLDSRVCAEIKITTAVISIDAFSPAELPEDLRALFQKHLRPE